ncbi:hypothetical protein Trydic_g9506 [Trypoxylus dichotomus]
MSEHITSSMDRSTPTAAIMLDIEKAFDKWQPYSVSFNGLARTDYGDELDPPQTTAEELLDIIKTLKNRKAPGRDGITNAAINHLHLGAIDALRDIINGVLRYQHFPQTWKHATVIVLHKTGKPKDSTDGYRPISLLPGLSKVLEKVIQRRLLEVVKKTIITMASKMCFDNFDEQALRKLIHTVMELYQTKFGDTPCAVESDFSEPVKTAKKRRTTSSAANPQPIITQNRFELLSDNEEEAEEMEEDVVEEINEPTPTETVQPSTSGRNKSEGTTAAKPVRKQMPIIIKETAKWTRTANLMREKRITATKSKLINSGIQVEPATEEDYRKLMVLRGITQDITDDEIKQDLQAQDYPVEKITRMKGKQGKPSPLVLVEIDRLYKSIYNITDCCGLAVKVEALHQGHRLETWKHLRP